MSSDPEATSPEGGENIHRRSRAAREAIARTLLDRPLPAGYMEDWAEHFAQTDASLSALHADDDQVRTVVVFRLGEEWLALPTSIFHEVAEPRPIRSLPHRRNRIVLGLVNVRGELLICVSLGEMIGIEARKAPERGSRTTNFKRLVVVGHEEKRVAFVVDEVHGIHRYRDMELQAVPATIGKAASTFASAMLSWKDRAVGCLDEARLLAMFDRSIG